MKKVMVALLLATLVTLTGCAALDSFFLEPLKNPTTHEKQYIDVEATEALPAEMKDEGKAVLVDESKRIPGRKYELAYSDKPSEAFGAVGQLAGGIGSMLGGWGAILGPVLGVIGAGYAAVRGKKKVNAAQAGKQAAVLGAAEIAHVMKDWQDGLIDANKDGEVTFDEIKAYLVKTGKERYANPAFVQSILSIVESSMTKSEKQAALEKAAESL